MSSARLIAVTSGKGGVGKTNITANLGIALARQGQRVCLFDADTSLANVNIVLGLEPKATLQDVIEGRLAVDDILLQGPEGVAVVPAASGVADMLNLDAGQRQRLMLALQALESRFDYLLIDTAAGIGDQVMHFLKSVPQVILLITPEPTSLTDAFSLIRVLRRKGGDATLHVVTNMVESYEQSRTIFKRFRAAVKRYIDTDVHYFGLLPRQASVSEAVIRRRPFLLQAPDGMASRCIRMLAGNLPRLFEQQPVGSRLSDYWRQALSEAGLELGDGVVIAGEQAWQRLGNDLQSGELSPEAFIDRLAELWLESPCFEDELDRAQALQTLQSRVLEQPPEQQSLPGNGGVGGDAAAAAARDEQQGLRQALALAARLGD